MVIGLFVCTFEYVKYPAKRRSTFHDNIFDILIVLGTSLPVNSSTICRRFQNKLQNWMSNPLPYLSDAITESSATASGSERDLIIVKCSRTLPICMTKSKLR